MKHTLPVLIGVVLCATAYALPPGLERAQQASSESRWKDAMALWEAASTEYPNDPDVTVQVGFAELNSGRLPDAMRSFSRALRLAPTNLLALTGTAQVAIIEHRFDDAVVIGAKAARTHPDSADAYRCLGDAQKASSHRSEAEDAYRRAVTLGPQDWRNHAALADAVLMRNKADEAVKEYRQAVKLNPNDGTLRESLARAAMAGARYGEAARCYVDAMDLARTPTPDWDRLDTLTLAALDAFSRAAAALRDGKETRQDVFEANTRALAVTDALLEVPSVASATPRDLPALAQRATAYGLMGQASAADLAALRKTSGSDAADAAVFREQARRAIVAAKAASIRTSPQ